MRSVLITGASSGIGEACALHLAERGVRVFAGVRNEPDGAALQKKATGGIKPVLIDVTRPETLAAARDRVAETESGSGLWGLVNNAGLTLGGPLEFTAPADIRSLFDVNFFGVIAVTQAFLPLLRRARGRIVNVSSISGRIALPFLGPYASSKFALEAISDSWRVELRPWGIGVSLVEPGEVKTPIHAKNIDMLRKVRDAYPPEAAALYGKVFGLSEQREPGGIPAERVARVVERALVSRRPGSRYLVGPDARMLSVLRRLPARLRDWLISSELPDYGS